MRQNGFLHLYLSSFPSQTWVKCICAEYFFKLSTSIPVYSPISSSDFIKIDSFSFFITLVPSFYKEGKDKLAAFKFCMWNFLYLLLTQRVHCLTMLTYSTTLEQSAIAELEHSIHFPPSALLTNNNSALLLACGPVANDCIQSETPCHYANTASTKPSEIWAQPSTMCPMPQFQSK